MTSGSARNSLPTVPAGRWVPPEETDAHAARGCACTCSSASRLGHGHHGLPPTGTGRTASAPTVPGLSPHPDPDSLRGCPDASVQKSWSTLPPSQLRQLGPLQRGAGFPPNVLNPSQGTPRLDQPVTGLSPLWTSGSLDPPGKGKCPCPRTHSIAARQSPTLRLPGGHSRSAVGSFSSYHSDLSVQCPEHISGPFPP